MVKSPIFIGIDPGTTTAYAILDLQGQIIDIHSDKNMGLNQLISDIYTKGLPLAVGTDKSKIPELIIQFAAKTGSKIISPPEDLKVEDKRELAKGNSVSDTHQMDALASAIYSFRYYSQLISKIRKHCHEAGKKDLLNEVILYCIKDGVMIKDAVQIASGHEEEEEIVKKALYVKQFSQRDFLRLYHKVKELESQLVYLRKQNSNLLNRNINLEKTLSQRQSKKIDMQKSADRKIDVLFSYKESRINELIRKNSEREKRIEELEAEIKNMGKFLSNATESVILKKMKNLGISEYNIKKEMLNIRRGDVLLIEDANIQNPQVISNLKGIVSILIHKGKINTNLNGFETIAAESLNILELDDFALVKREEIENKLEQRQMVDRVIREYRQSRSLPL